MADDSEGADDAAAAATVAVPVGVVTAAAVFDCRIGVTHVEATTASTAAEAEVVLGQTGQLVLLPLLLLLLPPLPMVVEMPLGWRGGGVHDDDDAAAAAVGPDVLVECPGRSGGGGSGVMAKLPLLGLPLPISDGAADLSGVWARSSVAPVLPALLPRV